MLHQFVREDNSNFDIRELSFFKILKCIFAVVLLKNMSADPAPQQQNNLSHGPPSQTHHVNSNTEKRF